MFQNRSQNTYKQDYETQLPVHFIQKISFSPVQRKAQSKAQKDSGQINARAAKGEEQQSQRREQTEGKIKQLQKINASF